MVVLAPLAVAPEVEEEAEEGVADGTRESRGCRWWWGGWLTAGDGGSPGACRPAARRGRHGAEVEQAERCVAVDAPGRAVRPFRDIMFAVPIATDERLSCRNAASSPSGRRSGVWPSAGVMVVWCGEEQWWCGNLRGGPIMIPAHYPINITYYTEACRHPDAERACVRWAQHTCCSQAGSQLLWPKRHRLQSLPLP